MANQIESNLFEEELSDADLMAVVGGTGTAGQTVVAAGYAFGDIGRGLGAFVTGVNQGGADVGRALRSDVVQTGEKIPA